MKNEKYTAGGYLFEDEESVKEARNEMEGVEYLKKRTNYKNPKSILNIYNTVIEKKLFKTPVGYEFLKQLQDYLLESEEIDGDQIMPIPVKRTTEKKGKKFSIPKIKRSIDKSSPYRNRFLNDNGARIHVGDDEMHRTTGNLDACFPRLSLSV